MLFVRVAGTLSLSLCVGLIQSAPIDDTSPLEKRASPASIADFNELHRAAQLSSAAYSACQGTAFGVTITLQIDDVETDTQGFIGYDESEERISVVLRGSTAILDFINDLDTTLVTPSLPGVSFPSTAQIMQGIYRPWSSIHDVVLGEVARLVALHPTYSLEATGHSLGGSLTYLGYVALAQNFPGKTVRANPLNAFPVGNAAFAEWAAAAEQGGTVWRGTNEGDGVPNMYAQLSHYGTEHYGSGTAASTLVCDGERDLECSAGDGAVGPNIPHLSSFGVLMTTAGCG